MKLSTITRSYQTLVNVIGGTNRIKIFVIVTVALLFSAAAVAQRSHRGGGRYFRGYYSSGYSCMPATPGFYFGFGGIGIGAGYRHYPSRGYYNSGFYTRPSIGVVIHTLPFGCRTIYRGSDSYYYYEGSYYRSYGRSRYEVVDAPMGAKIPSLPNDARTEVINGLKFYEYDGTYYREVITENGDILYEVVGKNAVLNTNEDAKKEEVLTIHDTNNETIGKETNQLPENCKTVVINQQKFYQSVTGFYYQEIIRDNKIWYKIVGKLTSTN